MKNEFEHIVADLDILDKIIARNDFEEFVRYIMPHLQFTSFHIAYYIILNLFAQGKIKHLIVSVPPQHGKSLGSSQLLPAYMLGRNPDLKIAIASYNATLASKFNKRTQRVIIDPKYTTLYPETRLKSTNTRTTRRVKGDDIYIQTSTEFDIVGKSGGLISVGREGALTGNTVDVFILDDLYKDAMEANSPVIRENCWEWYTDVVKTRQHNDSAELIVFTRWHEEDLIGTILSKQKHTILSSWEQIERLDPDEWLVVNFEALKESAPTEIDPRLEGIALWTERHSEKSLHDKRKLDPTRFECMYQGKPSTKEGLLYGYGFKTYTNKPVTIKKANYTDTADLGDDYLCSVCYEKDTEGKIYITDVLYTREGMEVTESATGQMIIRNDTREVYVESNNGGRGFARAVQKIATTARVEWFHQGENKEARIKTSNATVLQNIYFPADWSVRWSDFYMHLTTYRRNFKGNRWHDAADVLTGIIEKEIKQHSGGVRRFGRT